MRLVNNTVLITGGGTGTGLPAEGEHSLLVPPKKCPQAHALRDTKLRKHSLFSAIFLTLCLLPVPFAQAGEWSGQLGVEYRGFLYEPIFAEQHRNYFSLYAQPEYRHRWDNDNKASPSCHSRA